MFYYLLYNSSPLKNKKSKDRYVFTLIIGSLIYLVLHALISNTCNKDILKYIWFLLLIDISAVFVSSDFNGFSSVQFTTLTPPNILNPLTTSGDIESNSEFKETSNSNKPNQPKESKIVSPSKTKKIKKKKSNSSQDLKSILKKDKPEKKKVSFEESTDIQSLNSQVDTYNTEEANNINLTLESLENLQLDIEEEHSQFQVPRKKLEDEYSDIGSELDLAKFEDSITGKS